MANRLWLEQVEHRLIQSRLPSAYIRRFMDELADHYEDIMEDKMSDDIQAVERLGKPNEVADVAAVAFQQRTFFGRHPSAKFWVFGISPMVAMVAVFVLACFGVIAFGGFCEKCGVRLADHDYFGGLDPVALSWFFSFVTTIVPAALLTMLYCRCVKRLKVSRRWMLVSCAVVALVAMLPIQNILLSDEPGKSLWSIGLELPPNLLQCIQLLVPLTIGLWFVRRTSEKISHEDLLQKVQY